MGLASMITQRYGDLVEIWWRFRELLIGRANTGPVHSRESHSQEIYSDIYDIRKYLYESRERP
jgi:hypothetical protein